MFARSALMLLFAASFSALPAAVVPKSKVDLLADPTFKDWVFHLSENNSVSTRREDVAVIKDGVLQVTGKGFGYFRTKESYQDYHLVLDYKWGENTWSKRKDRARDCGLLPSQPRTGWLIWRILDSLHPSSNARGLDGRHQCPARQDQGR